MSYLTGYSGLLNPSQSITIDISGTDSTVINCGGMTFTGFILPSLFTGTLITFLIGNSADGFQANGLILFTGTTTNGDTININGVTLTFVSTTPGANQIAIGADAAGTAANLQTFLNATVNASLLACTYSTVGALVTVTAVTAGTGGNSIVFSESSTNITMTPSGGLLTGGGFRQLFDNLNAAVSMTISQGRAYAVDPRFFQGVQFVKLRAGTAQAAPRTIICSLKGF